MNSNKKDKRLTKANRLLVEVNSLFLAIVLAISFIFGSFGGYIFSKHWFLLLFVCVVIVILLILVIKGLNDKEKQINEEKEKQVAVLTNLVDGIIFIDKKGEIISVNPQAERLLNFKAGDVIGLDEEEIDYTKYPALEDIIKSNTKSDQEIKPTGKADTVIKVVTVLVEDKNDQIVGKVKIIHDISREKFLNRIKSEFITIAGHQLRTPLTAVKNALDLLRSGDFGDITEEQKSILDKCYYSNERLIELVHDLLNVSSIEEGRFNYQYYMINLKNLFEEIADEFLSAAKAKNIEIEKNFEGVIPDILADEYKLKLAISSILDNALNYSRENSKIELGLKFDKKTEKVLLIVKDYGAGIPKDVQEKMFTKFFRADNALRMATEGNGLDLFISKNIILNHDGKIWFKSKIDKGTTFYIELPLQTKKNVG